MNDNAGGGAAPPRGPHATIPFLYGAVSTVDERARSSHRLHAMAERVADDDERARLCESQRVEIFNLVSAPALDHRDLTRKLAMLVTELLRSTEEPDRTMLQVAASSLADAVVLDSGPIILPAEFRKKTGPSG